MLLPWILGPMFGKIADKQKPELLVVGGLLLSLLGWVPLSYISENTVRQRVILFVSLLFMGTFFAIVQTSSSVQINKIVREEHERCPGTFGPHGGTAQANAFIVEAFAVGSLIGAFVAWGCLQGQGWSFLCYLATIICAASAILVNLVSGLH